MDNTNNNNKEQQGKLIVNNLLNKPSKETVQLIASAIQSGEADPAYVGVVLKKFSKIAEEVKKDKITQEIIENETKKYQEGTAKTFPVHGAKVTLANRGYWDYSLTEDEYLTRLKDIEKEVKELIKLREKYLQNLVAEYEIKTKPKNVSAEQAFGDSNEEPIKFGVEPFNVAWDKLPKLEWEEAYAEVSTIPPVKRNIESLRYNL